MKVIHKYPLTITDYQTVLLPEEVEFISLQVQNGVPCLWVMRNPDSIPEPRTIRSYATGEEFPAIPTKFLGTVLMHGGTFVLHYFIETRTFNHQK